MSHLGRYSILIVDDEADSLMVFKDTLEMLHGATVKTARNVAEAIKSLETFHPTLIVTDLSMPHVDGYSLLHQLRGRADTAALPIIALTAHAMAGDREHILAAGFDGYISKPFEAFSVGDELLKWLSSYEARRT